MSEESSNPRLRTGYIYGIRQAGSSSLKIGKSIHDPRVRMATLQTGNPTQLRLEFRIGTHNIDAAETYAHAVLAKRRTTGEWFHVPFWARWRVRRQVRLACGKASANLLDTIYTEYEAAHIDAVHLIPDYPLPFPRAALPVVYALLVMLVLTGALIGSALGLY